MKYMFILSIQNLINRKKRQTVGAFSSHFIIFDLHILAHYAIFIVSLVFTFSTANS